MINIVMDSQILTALQECPRKYFYRFGKNLVSVGGKSNSLENGSLAHIILEWYYKSLINGATTKESMNNGLDAGHEYIRGYDVGNKYIKDPNEKGLFNTEAEDDFDPITKTPRVGYNRVISTMEEYFDYYRGDNFIPLHVEHVLGEVIYKDDEMQIIWKAKYDLIGDFSDGIMPVDHKSSKMDKAISSMNNQFMGQCVLTKTRRMMVNKIGFQKTLPIEKRLKRVIVNYTSDRLYEWQNIIVPHYARMLYAYAEAENFPMCLTSCTSGFWCDYLKICESDSILRDSIIKLDYEERKPWDISND